jgi:hypothetical protein
MGHFHRQVGLIIARLLLSTRGRFVFFMNHIYSQFGGGKILKYACSLIVKNDGLVITKYRLFKMSFIKKQEY